MASNRKSSSTSRQGSVAKPARSAQRVSSDPQLRVSQSSLAHALLEKIRALKSDIPGFSDAPPGRSRLSNVASVPDGFLEAATVAVESSVVLQTATGLAPDVVREAIAFAAAFVPVAEEAEALARSVRHTIAVRRSQAGIDALQAYNIAKGLARKPEGAVLSSHIQEMKRTLGRGPHKKTPATAPGS